MGKRQRHFFSFEEECQNMAFDLGFKLKEIDGVVHENSSGDWLPICIPTGDNSMWFETWLEMKKKIAESNFRFKDYS